MLLLVILMSFLTIRGYGEPLTTELRGLTGNGMRFYNESEVQGMIEELTETAKEAIETAAAEAARTAVLASLEREAKAVKEAEHWRGEYRAVRKAGIKNAVLAGVICFFAGAVAGSGAVLIFGGR
jgi:hypothetical protein